MKLSFDTAAMNWLHATVNKLIVVSHKVGEEQTSRTARKMRHKFHGNPPVVFLTAKERQLIASVVAYRLEALQTQVTDERAVLTQIAEVLNES